MFETVPAVLQLADDRAITTHEAACAIAERRLDAASAAGRLDGRAGEGAT